MKAQGFLANFGILCALGATTARAGAETSHSVRLGSEATHTAVRLLGTIRLESHHESVRDERSPFRDWIRWEGLARDELGHPLNSTTVEFSSPVAECGQNEAKSAQPQLTTVPVRADGRFCVFLDRTTIRKPVKLTAPEHFPLVLEIENLPQTVFDPRLDIISLPDTWAPESAERTLHLALRATGSPHVERVSAGLRCPSGTRGFPDMFPDEGGEIRASVDEDPGLPAGRCNLVLQGHFAGGSTKSVEQDVLLRRTVRLSVSENRGTYEVRAATSVEQTVGGMVEARDVDGKYLTGHDLVNGKVELDLSHLDNSELRFSFASQAPWFVPGPALQIRHEKPRNFLTDPRFHVTGLGLLLLALLAKTLRVPRTPVPRIESGGEALVRETARDTHFQGTVKDTHTGTPVNGAKISIARKTATESVPIGECTTGEQGDFSFEKFSRADTLELTVTSPTHITFTASVRGGHRIDVHIVSRRRALLTHLSRFLGRAPRYGALTPTATPEGVRRASLVEENRAVEGWAEAIDQLAFGPEEPSERAVNALEPPITASAPEH